ncbi:MAG: hypothetical protein C6H99_06135 [Epsilonproteobacteria bacterium]|nr:hypothetical protein [Campylobacterota bacterium]NPA65181.1 hypothetical protein [Campylobacterota bacterium]
MKKVLIALILLVLIVVGALFGLVFTKPGNEFLRPLIEKNLAQKLPVPVKLSSFSVSPMDIELLIGKESKVTLKGDVDIFSQHFDIDYDVRIARLEELEPLIGQKLQGPFNTWGKVAGDIKKFEVKGQSDLAKSDTNYDVVVEDLDPKSVLAHVKNASISHLLYMVAQPSFAKGRLDATAKLIDLDPDHLKGDVVAKLRNTLIDRKVMKKEFGVTLPKTMLQADAKAKLAGEKIDIDTRVDSNLLKTALTGAVNAKSMGADLEYDIKIRELALLKPLTKADLRGALNTHGTVKGDKKKMVVKGVTDVGGSNSDYEVVLKDLAPSALSAHIKGAKLRKLLYMVAQPIYADGVLDSTIKLTDLNPATLSGSIVSQITKGRTNPVVLKKEFDLQNAKITFDLNQKSDIKKGLVVSDVIFSSNVAKALSKGAKFDIKSGKFEAKYRVDVPDLNRLYFITKQKMRGKLTITGEAKKDKDLIVTAHSDTLGGKFDMKMINDDVKATLKGIKVVALTDMLYYPRVFDSTMDARLGYNLATKKGKLNAKAFNGQILPNQMTFLLKQMANFDITKEIYKVTELNSTINDKVILSDLDMKSRLTHISSKKALLDMNKNYVDAKLRIDIKGKPLYVKIKGRVDSPKVSLDAKSLFKDKAKKELEKKLGDKIPGNVKGMLNNLF